jgi:hypothetical protein
VGVAVVDCAAGIKSSDRAMDKRTAEEEEEEEGDSDEEDGDQTVEMMDDDASGRTATRFPLDNVVKLFLYEKWWPAFLKMTFKINVKLGRHSYPNIPDCTCTNKILKSLFCKILLFR